MMRPRSVNPNSDEYQAGETLFDFLKRKKKVALEKSLSRSRQKENQSVLSNRIQSVTKDKFSTTKTQDDTLRQLYASTQKNNTKNMNNVQTFRSGISNQLNSITPKKVTFADQKPIIHSTRSSFIQMISPLNKKSITHTPTKEDPPINKVRKDSQEIFYRKNLNKSINILQTTIQQLMTKSKQIKQKSHVVFLEMKPLIKFIEESSNSSLSKKTQQLKLKIRTLEHVLGQFCLEDFDQNVQAFHQSLSEHLLSLEANIRSSFQKEQMNTFKNVRDDKEKKIQQMAQVQYRLQRELEMVKKQLEKSNKQMENLQQTSDETINNETQNFTTLINQLSNKISTYQHQIATLSEQLSKSKVNQIQLEKLIKDLKFLHTESQRKFLQQNTKVKSTKEEYLLNELAILKQQFKADMTQLTHLYSNKEKDYLELIDELKLRVNELTTRRMCDKETESKILCEAAHTKNQAEKYKKQNECLVTDLHRMNQELYQHWLALKDIKTLASRLQIYSKFDRIFGDLKFNDLLFV